MPYIKQERRKVYNETLEEIWNLVENDPELQCEYISCMTGRNDNHKIYQLCIKLKNELLPKFEDDNYSGDLNYCISYIYFRSLKKANYCIQNKLKSYVRSAQSRLSVVSSLMKNDKISGVLDDVALEGYIRFTRPYEDKKIEENGDIL